MLLLLCDAGCMSMPPQALAAGFMMVGGCRVEVLSRAWPGRRLQVPCSVPGEAVFFVGVLFSRLPCLLDN